MVYIFSHETQITRKYVQRENFYVYSISYLDITVICCSGRWVQLNQIALHFVHCFTHCWFFKGNVVTSNC